ncbi:MAG: hypothetical protein ACXW3O_01045 [Brevundimonas sp.]
MRVGPAALVPGPLDLEPTRGRIGVRGGGPRLRRPQTSLRQVERVPAQAEAVTDDKQRPEGQDQGE